MANPWDNLTPIEEGAAIAAPATSAAPWAGLAPLPETTTPLPAMSQAQADQQRQSPLTNAAHFTGTAILKGVGNLAGTPHTLATLGDKAIDLFSGPPGDMTGMGANLHDPTLVADRHDDTPSGQNIAVGGAAISPGPGLINAGPGSGGQTVWMNQEQYTNWRKNSGLPVDVDAPTSIGQPPGPGFLTQHTYSPDEVNTGIFTGLSNASQAMGRGPRYPYEPTSDAGKVAMAGLSNVVPSLVGPAGIMSTVAREGAGIAGGAGAEAYGLKNPDDYWGQLGAGLTSALAGGMAPGLIKGGITSAGSLIRPSMAETAAEPKVANALASAAGVPGSQLAQTIDTNLPLWTPGTKPDLGNVTENTGIRGLVYQDQVAARRADNPVYQNNAMTTNEAQRAAVAGATPSDAAAALKQMADDRDVALGSIPQGLDAQDAGNLFRQNLQTVQDQRRAMRAGGGSMFEALEKSPAQIDLTPISDYATSQAAQNAGVVGDAYKTAAAQFKSGTGITLDTAPFANSVLKGLGDTAAGYPAGSAQARAVNDVKARLEAHLADPATGDPAIGAARDAWAANSRPLDVFDSPPFGQVLATDRFGRGYTMPSDSVTSTFLRGNGSADSLDALNNIFPNRETATRALGDYMAGQVRQNALSSDGTLNVDAMNRTLRPFQNALIRFPQLSKQFSTAAGAQQALEQQTAYQGLYNKVTTELGTGMQDSAENQMYSPAKYRAFVNQNRDLINKAYTPEQAAVVNRVNDELQNVAQTAYAKVPGTSGTPQHNLAIAGAHIGGGGLTGTVGGFALGHIFGHGEIGGMIGMQIGGVAGALKLIPKQAFETVRRNALTDPEYARSLLVKYNPSGDPASVRAMQYIAQRTPALALPPPSEKPMQAPAMQSQAPQAASAPLER
jgi:hypothetical protein